MAETNEEEMDQDHIETDTALPETGNGQSYADYTGIPVTYYPINENAARRAKEMNSFFDYVPGSATKEYRHYVDQAVQIAEQQKEGTDPIYHEKIDRLVDTYARKLADNMNRGYEISARVPSVMIAGASNFPTRKKEKQNAASDKNMEEWRQVQGILDKIRSTGTGGIRSDHPHAIEQLEQKLERLENTQKLMKDVNAFYRKNKTLDGCPLLDGERLQLLFEEKPSAEHRAQLKANGFRWAPKAGVWQRLLNRQAIYAAGRIEFIRPLSGQTPQELQPKAGQQKEKRKVMER